MDRRLKPLPLWQRLKLVWQLAALFLILLLFYIAIHSVCWLMPDSCYGYGSDNNPPLFNP